MKCWANRQKTFQDTSNEQETNQPPRNQRREGFALRGEGTSGTASRMDSNQGLWFYLTFEKTNTKGKREEEPGSTSLGKGPPLYFVPSKFHAGWYPDYSEI